MSKERTLLQILRTLWANKSSFTCTGRLNQAHEDFLKKLPDSTEAEKSEALEFLKGHNELDYSGTGISLQELKLSLGWNPE